MDARAMEFEEGAFDGAIDKGTLDAVLVTSILICSAESPLHRMLRR